MELENMHTQLHRTLASYHAKCTIHLSWQCVGFYFH